MTDRPTLIDYLIIIFKWKKLIVATVLAFVVTAVIAVYLIPPVYLAEARILPPNTDNSTISTQLLGQLGGVSGGISFPGGMGRSTNDLYVGLLQSRTILNRVVDRFKLGDVYCVKFRKEAADRLLANMRLNNDKKSGLISIGVEDRDPRRAAEIAGSLVEELTLLTQEVAITEASQRRLFYENKLKDTKSSLLKAEEAMKGFQEKTGTIEMKEQAKAIIEASARLRAQIASKEVSIKVLKTYAMPQNPDLQKTEDELKGMKEQLQRMDTKSGNKSDKLVSTGSVLEAGTGYIRKLRDLKYYETLSELLSMQYEFAKMDESKHNAPIQVIDKAYAPEKRERPKRTKTVAIAALVGLFSGLILAFIMENRDRLSGDPEMMAKLETLKQYAMIRSGRA